MSIKIDCAVLGKRLIYGINPESLEFEFGTVAILAFKHPDFDGYKSEEFYIEHKYIDYEDLQLYKNYELLLDEAFLVKSIKQNS